MDLSLAIPHPAGLFSGRMAARIGLADCASLHQAPSRSSRAAPGGRLALLVQLPLLTGALALLMWAWPSLPRGLAATQPSASAPSPAALPPAPGALGALGLVAASWDVPPSTSLSAATPASALSIQSAPVEASPSAVRPSAEHRPIQAVAAQASGMALPAIHGGSGSSPDDPSPVLTPRPAALPIVAAPAVTTPAVPTPVLPTAAIPGGTGEDETESGMTVILLAKVTGYCPCALCCGPDAAGITSINRDVHRHPRGIAVDPRLIPYRTSLLIPGYGRALADDTGAAMRQDGEQGVLHIDVRFRTHAEAQRWGVRWIRIAVPRDCPAAILSEVPALPAD